MSMKKTLVICLLILSTVCVVFAQTNASVDMDEEVYQILRNAETRALCSTLSYARPYTAKYIVSKLEEILDNLDKLEDNEITEKEKETAEFYIRKYSDKPEVQDKISSFWYENGSETFPITFHFNNSIYDMYSSGLYADSDFNSSGYELYDNFSFSGDFGNNISYRSDAFVGLTKMPLMELGQYDIGEWLYHSSDDRRYITKYVNNSVLPYSYHKYWDGSVYFLTQMDASGLKGWPFTTALAFAMNGEIRGSFLEDNLQIGIGRNTREYAAMDYGSSLVLNSNARPFLAFDARFKLFDWLSLSTLTGVLEFPNQDYMNADAWYMVDEDGNKANIESKDEDYNFFQNAFSLAEVDIDLSKWHLDFGSTCVWPKRFELGYAFPLIDRVVYQNDIGDYDNLALFGNLKYTNPGVGSVWFSGYLDEINAFTTKFWKKTRAMFALQAGTKVAIPFMPFTTLSLRYTKVEPYCYTHHGINYTSWYDHYLSEAYMNNGEPLGYYLQPNSDEFHIRMESNPNTKLSLGLQYQLIRHGVDWGTSSHVGIGNSIYSELRNRNRDDLYKYFLHDGIYEWTNIMSVSGSYGFKIAKTPVKIYAVAGGIYNWFTDIEGEPGRKTPYTKINTAEYANKNGVVLTLGFKIN